MSKPEKVFIVTLRIPEDEMSSDRLSKACDAAGYGVPHRNEAGEYWAAAPGGRGIRELVARAARR